MNLVYLLTGISVTYQLITWFIFKKIGYVNNYRFHCFYLKTVLFCFSVIIYWLFWFQVFLSSANNFYIIIWFQVTTFIQQ